MTKSQEIEFRDILLRRQDELRRQIEAGLARLEIDRSSDSLDVAHRLQDLEVVRNQLSRLCMELRLVDGALGEIRDQTFGVCARCAGAIPVKRLEAVPWSPYCVACQEQFEDIERWDTPEFGIAFAG